MLELDMSTDGENERGTLADRSAQILFQTAAAKIELSKAAITSQFTEMVGATPTAEDYKPALDALKGVAEACFGQPFSEIRIKMTPEQQKNLRRITKEIQDGMRQKGIDPRIIYGDNIIE